MTLFLHADCFVISNRGRLLGITDLKITKPQEEMNKEEIIGT